MLTFLNIFLSLFYTNNKHSTGSSRNFLYTFLVEVSQVVKKNVAIDKFKLWANKYKRVNENICSLCALKRVCVCVYSTFYINLDRRPTFSVPNVPCIRYVCYAEKFYIIMFIILFFTSYNVIWDDPINET